MPRLVDWGVRYELIREAVVRIVARDGVAAVSMAAVAGELHVSLATLRRTLDRPDRLLQMGVSLLARQRRSRRLMRGCPPGVVRGSVEHIAWILAAELPKDEEDRDQQRAWIQLTGPGAGEAAANDRCTDDDYLDDLMVGILERLGTEMATRRQQAIRVRALLDGLIAASCREEVTADEAYNCLETCLRELPLEPRVAVSPSGA
jgi:AcrR family transcriptional regulator